MGGGGRQKFSLYRKHHPNEVKWALKTTMCCALSTHSPQKDPTMAQHTLRLFSDIQALSKEEVEQLAQELPGIWAVLRMAGRQANQAGLKLDDVLPSVIFDSELKNEIVIVGAHEKMHVSGDRMLQADAIDEENEVVNARSKMKPH
jgi:hypothetical protein